MKSDINETDIPDGFKISIVFAQRKVEMKNMVNALNFITLLKASNFQQKGSHGHGFKSYKEFYIDVDLDPSDKFKEGLSSLMSEIERESK